MGIFSFLKQEPNILKEMGFVGDQSGIIDRYAREKDGWDIHLNNAKQTIIDAIEFHQAKSVSILGSGWLLDIPIEELSKRCEQVYLYDIVHPAQIKHRVSKFNNITLIEADITGGAIQKTWTEVQRIKHKVGNIHLESITGNGFVQTYETDLIVSLNILNQLDILICDYILLNSSLKKEELSSLRLAIQQKHIESIAKQAFCLITDYEEIITSITDNSSITQALVIVELPITDNQKQWQWQFDNSGYYYEDKRVVFNVKALY